jgi:hypothetical protein
MGMKIDKIFIETSRDVCDFNENDPTRDDRCSIILSLEIRISDSKRKDIHNVLSSHFTQEAESLILEIREFIDKNKS